MMDDSDPEDELPGAGAMSDDQDDDVDEDSGEELVGNDMMRDYRAEPELDAYEAEGIEQGEVEELLDPEAQQDAIRAAAAENERRRRLEGRGAPGLRRGLPAAFLEDDAEGEAGPRRRRRADAAAAGEAAMEEEEEEEVEIDLTEQKPPIRTRLASPAIIAEVKRRIRKLLTFFKDASSSRATYLDKIATMTADGKQSLEVSYMHISHDEPTLAVWVADFPAQVLPHFDSVLQSIVDKAYPKYRETHVNVVVRISELPITDAIRDIRKGHLDSLVQTSGVVVRRTGVFPKQEKVVFDCPKCAAPIGPFHQQGAAEVRPAVCPQCQYKGKGFTVNIALTVYRPYQKLVVQESPGTVPAGRLPRSKEVILMDDLIDCARPGDQIVVTGIYTHNFDASLNTKNGAPVFSTVIEANHVFKKAGRGDTSTDKEKSIFRKWARQPGFMSKLIDSFAPSIYGHNDIKLALLLSMVGGQCKSGAGKHRMRGDINVLLLGDPGTAKSQFLKYVEKTASRAVYTTGKGASAVGLTAAVHKDPLTREWTLEGGALVLADRGVCLIDEFDKMNDKDRVSIHEAMEQQSISISKAGIVTSLQARCAVIAAANPIGGRYDPTRNLTDNVELTDPILSRFDIICVVKDSADPVNDRRLALFVVDSHHASHPDCAGPSEAASAAAGDMGAGAGVETDSNPISQDMLRKYIAFVKESIHPKLPNADADKLAHVYAELRREAAASQGAPIAVRHQESMIRMAEAHAALHLREHVNDDDVDVAIRVMLESFISTQRASVQKTLQRVFRKYTSAKRDYFAMVLNLLRSLLREALHYEELVGNLDPMSTPRCRLRAKQLEDRAREYGITDLQAFYASKEFLDNHFRLDADRRTIVYNFSEEEEARYGALPLDCARRLPFM